MTVEATQAQEIVEAAPVVEAAVAPAAVEAAPDPAPSPEPVNEPSLLETATAKPAGPEKGGPQEAPAAQKEPEPPAVAKETASGPVAAPEAPAPVEYKYELPETLKMEDAQRARFHSALDAFRNSEDHSPQELIKLHEEALTNFASETRQRQWDTFNGVRKSWRDAVMADEEIGGNGHQTAMTDIARVRDALVKPEEMEDFNKMLAGTGVGDHPLFLKMLHRARRFVNEGVMPPPGAKPAPNNGQAPKRTLRDLYK